MKYNKSRKFSIIARYAFLVIAAAILFYLCLVHFADIGNTFFTVVGYIQPIWIGLILAFLINPLMKLLENRFLPWAFRKKLKSSWYRTLGILIAYLIMALVFFFFIILVIPRLTQSLADLTNNLIAAIPQINPTYEAIKQSITTSEFVENLGIESTVVSFFDSFVGDLQVFLKELSQQLPQMITSLFNGILSTISSVVNVILGVIISVYFLTGKEKLLAQCRKICVAIFPERASNVILDTAKDANRILSGYVIGALIDAVIVGVLCFILMNIFGIAREYSVLVSLIIACTNVIPYFGPFLGGIPSFLLIFVQNPRQALFFAILIVVLQQIDGNIIAPKIQEGNTGLPALWVIFGIMMFGGILGIPGMFIGVPLFAIIYSLISRYINYRLRLKEKSTETAAYLN